MNAMENSMAVPKKLKYDPAIPLSRYIPKRIESRDLSRYLYTNIIAVLFIIAKRWTQYKCPSMDEWIKQVWYIHTSSVLKRNEILIHATVRMNLENIMLSEITHTEKDK